MRYLPQAPNNRGFTILLAVLWVALLIYIITNPSPTGIVVLIIFSLFVLPMFALTFWLQRNPQQARDLPDYETEPDETEHAQNGHR